MYFRRQRNSGNGTLKLHKAFHFETSGSINIMLSRFSNPLDNYCYTCASAFTRMELRGPERGVHTPLSATKAL